MRCAILALAAGLLMIAGSFANACDKCAQHANYVRTSSCGCKHSGHQPHFQRCGKCQNGSHCGGHGCRPGLLDWLRWEGRCGRCFPGGMHGGAGHLGNRGGAPIGPGGPYTGPSGPSAATYGYPYYTIRGPRDFLMDNPPTIGR